MLEPCSEQQLERLENVFLAMKDENFTTKQVMLHSIFQVVKNKFFKPLHDTGDSNSYDKANLELSKYFKPYRNVNFEQNTFRQTRQKVEESND